MNDRECCDSPRLYCNVCKKGACNKHKSSLMVSHRATDVLTPSGLPIFLCGSVAVSYIVQGYVVIFEDIIKVAEQIVDGSKKEKANKAAK